MKPLRLGFVTDPSIFSKPEEESAGLLQAFNELVGIPAELAMHAHYLPEIYHQEIDLLVIDYGGLASRGDFVRPDRAIRLARTWAIDHPGKVLLIWTEYTASLYREIEEELGHARNVLIYGWEDIGKPNRPGSIWWQIRRWYGVPVIPCRICHEPVETDTTGRPAVEVDPAPVFCSIEHVREFMGYVMGPLLEVDTDGA